MSATVRRKAAHRLRFGAFLVIALFAVTLLASHNGAAVWPPGGTVVSPTAVSMTINGHGYVTDFEIAGAGGGSSQTFAFSRSLACSSCAVRFHLDSSSITVAGGGQFGILPAGKEYEVANFAGHIGLSAFGAHDYALTLDGVAEKVRVAPADYPYAK